jgi:hypothetical protein
MAGWKDAVMSKKRWWKLSLWELREKYFRLPCFWAIGQKAEVATFVPNRSSDFEVIENDISRTQKTKMNLIKRLFSIFMNFFRRLW